MEKITETSSVQDVVNSAVIASDTFEELGRTKAGVEIKKKYIQANYDLYREVGRASQHAVASFTTGYPGYNLSLKEIDEQYRYNHELLKQIQALGIASMQWKCGGCLIKNYEKMPNLKQVCYPCTNTPAEVKPRKILNRLPDLDIWYVYDDSEAFNSHPNDLGIENRLMLMDELQTELAKRNMHTSDISPITTINEMAEVSKALKNFSMPNIHLPVDVHIVGLEYLKNLIQNVPQYMALKLSNTSSENLKINPDSLRKTWEFDSDGYNFVFDFLLSFSVIPLSKLNRNYPYTQKEKELIELVNMIRSQVVQIFDEEEIMKVLLSVSGAPAQRRLQSQSLLDEFYTKIGVNWKSGNYEKGNWILEETTQPQEKQKQP